MYIVSRDTLSRVYSFEDLDGRVNSFEDLDGHCFKRHS